MFQLILIVFVLNVYVTPTLSIFQSPPRIVKQPPTDELLFQVFSPDDIINEKPFIIECEAEAEPPPKYRWVKNGKNFEWQTYDDRISQQPGRGTLVISSPRDEDLGQYQCFAYNEWGTATSNSAFVRKAELNNFKDEGTIRITAQEGNPLKLQCSPPDGWPKPNVYWLLQDSAGIKSINNSRMTVDPEGNLWFTNVTRHDAFPGYYYTCAAASKFRNEYKLGNRVQLNVVANGISASQNKHQPVQQYVTRKIEIALRGSKVEIFCIFGGTPLPEMVWTKDGVTIPVTERVSQGNFGKSIVIKDVNFDDQGRYTCEASNGVGEAKTYSVNLQVLSAPYFTVEPDFVNAAESETVEIKCEASGTPEPQIKWIFNGKPIAEAAVNERRQVKPNSIIVKDLKKSDTGNYGCNATNSIGYVYKDVYINVLALPPEIEEPPQDISVVDGKTITVTCRVFGAPRPEVKWIRQGVELTGGRFTIMPTGDLLVKDVNFLDAGNYTCHVSNKFGQLSASAIVQVKEHTRITDAPEDYEVPAGTTATFRCNAVADSSLVLNIDWLKNGELIDLDTEPRFFRSSDHSLIITKTTELDSGIYTCIASTGLDSATSSATLIVEDVPNEPQLKDVACYRRSASVSWKPMGDNRSPILRFIIQYNTSFTPDTWEDANRHISSTEMTYSVPMSPWANYTFRVIAVNKIGHSTASPHSRVCTTQPDVPYKNPDNIAGEGIEPNNMIISWTPMPQIEHNGPRFKYRVYYQRALRGESWESFDVTDWKQSKVAIPNLLPFQRHWIKVIAINEIGEANVLHKPVLGYSGEDVPTQAPTNLTIIKTLSSTSAIISWNPVPLDSINGHFQGYKVQTWSDKTGEVNIQTTDFDVNTTHGLIKGFMPFTRNYARVLAFNSRYNGPSSQVVTLDMEEGVPGTVLSLEAVPLGYSSFLIIWQKPELLNGILTGYNIYYQKSDGTELGPVLEKNLKITDPTATRAKLAGLESGTKYRVYIRATTNAGEGEAYFVEQSTRTVATKPDVPKFNWDILHSENGLAVIKISWMPNYLYGNPGSHFFVAYKIKNSPRFDFTENVLDQDYIIIRGLDPTETYEFKVIAVDGDNLIESESEFITMYVDNTAPIIDEKENPILSAWFFGLLFSLLILFGLLFFIYIIKKKRGGSYVVLERDPHERREYVEDTPYPDYSQPLERQRDYGETDDNGYNEQGSFMPQHTRTSGGGVATVV